MAKVEVTTFVVRGTPRNFPFDMLRYDKAWPSDRGAAALSNLRHTEEPVVEVELITHGKVTDGRWESFGWRVVRVDTRSY